MQASEAPGFTEESVNGHAWQLTTQSSTCVFYFVKAAETQTETQCKLSE